MNYLDQILLHQGNNHVINCSTHGFVGGVGISDDCPQCLVELHKRYNTDICIEIMDLKIKDRNNQRYIKKLLAEKKVLQQQISMMRKIYESDSNKTIG